MPSLADIIPQGDRVDSHRPWPRVIVTVDDWRHVTGAIAVGRATLLGLWGDSDATPAVHMAIMAEATGEIAVLTLACPAGTFPSVGRCTRLPFGSNARSTVSTGSKQSAQLTSGHGSTSASGTCSIRLHRTLPSAARRTRRRGAKA